MATAKGTNSVLVKKPHTRESFTVKTPGKIAPTFL